ncbi:S-layer homology domain-containing protein [Carboxydocella sporoproducens DSM 16521]|uniref:S-layer homology domain-containing protein n=2 Tax=Carboxydocella TaxID=178898 RepID=A0A1T4MKX2_9FIRM|nr:MULTISPECIES: S-layer homology domain-containing protein [Carboxydocella]AVX21373.1 SLH domain-containing protein [Carboxydocella thermautotrophica]SJZ67593.1 S-layer homology domain-containing protein [Carboxydocella sporoproducens DSM 16521]
MRKRIICPGLVLLLLLGQLLPMPAAAGMPVWEEWPQAKEVAVLPGTNRPAIWQDIYQQGESIIVDQWEPPYPEGINDDYLSESQMVDQFLWDNPRALLVFPAGDRAGYRNLLAPAVAKNALVVGGSQSLPWGNSVTANVYDSWRKAEFSTGGPALDRIKPDILAPAEWWATLTPQGYQPAHGTLYAATWVKVHLDQWRQKLLEAGIEPIGALLKAIAVAAAYPEQYSSVEERGYGFFRPHSLNQAWDELEFIQGELTEETPSQTFSWVSPASIPTGYRLAVVLTWMDYPAEIGDGSLVNDLNLDVRADIYDQESGQNLLRIYTPNDLADSAGAENNTDNCERILLSNLQPGTEYRITVEAVSLIQGPQPFALVYGLIPDAGPELRLENLPDQMAFASSSYLLKGWADQGATVKINNAVVTTTGGYWTYELQLNPGINTINVLAEKEGKQTLIKRNLWLDPQSTPYCSLDRDGRLLFSHLAAESAISIWLNGQEIQQTADASGNKQIALNLLPGWNRIAVSGTPAGEVERPLFADWVYFQQDNPPVPQDTGDDEDGSSPNSMDDRYMGLREKLGSAYQWALPEIGPLWVAGIIKGDERGLRPGDNMTRAEFISLLMRAFPWPAGGQAADFADIHPAAWYAVAINQARSLGLVYGVGSNRFEPSKPITRAEAIMILARAYRIRNLLTSGENQGLETDWQLAAEKGWTKYNLQQGFPFRYAKRVENMVMVSRWLQ